MHDNGLIIGKFMPLHKGHLALVDFARQHCHKLTIALCFTEEEPIPGKTREQWLRETYSGEPGIEIACFPYSENELPNTSVSSREVSMRWGQELSKRFPHTDIVFSSEPYGDYLAEYMGTAHLCFDRERSTQPVSGTMIRQAPLSYWDYLADAAKPYYVRKVVILGTESTGKSTLAIRLANHFQTSYVPEMARYIIEKTAFCRYEHLLEIAELHAKTIGEQLPRANKLLFIDTDLAITRSYARFLFNRELQPLPDWIIRNNHADLSLFLTADCEFIQDGTRLDAVDRMKLNISHLEELKREERDYRLISGNWDTRFHTSCEMIQMHFFNP